MAESSSLPLVVAAVSVVIALFSLAWNIYRDLFQWQTRLKTHAAAMHSTTRDSTRYHIDIAVTNAGRTTALIRGAGVHGALASCTDRRSVVDICAEMDKQLADPTLKKYYRRKSGVPNTMGDPIRLEPGDAHSFSISVNWSLVRDVPGKYWGAHVYMRNGKQIIVPASKILNAEYFWAAWMGGIFRKLPEPCWLEKWYRDKLSETRAQIQTRLKQVEHKETAGPSCIEIHSDKRE